MFIRIYSLAAFLSLSVVAIMNYVVDPAGQFYANGAIERAMAQTLSKGDNTAIVIPYNYDERLFQRNRLQIDTYKPDVLVLGSSRVLQITRTNYPKSVLNLGVSGATIQDISALLVMALDRWQPKEIIIGIDPLLFYANPGQTRWNRLAKEYEIALARLKPSPEPIVLKSKVRTKWSQLINQQYTAESVKKLKALIGGKSIVNTSPDDTPREHADLIRKDGSRVYNTTYAHRSPSEVSNDIDLWSRYPFEGSIASPGNWALMEALLDYAKDRSTVKLFIAPYHPGTYAKIMERFPKTSEIEKAVHALAKKKNIAIYGAYDPAIAGCSHEEFYDGAHLKGSCVKKILTNR